MNLSNKLSAAVNIARGALSLNECYLQVKRHETLTVVCFTTLSDSVSLQITRHPINKSDGKLRPIAP